MAQYQVPKFIDIEDRIIGPLTLKQFLYLAFAGAFLFVFFFLFKFFIWIIIALPVTVLAFAFAFLKINDRPFAHFFIAAIFYFLKPRIYIFGAAQRKLGQEIVIKSEPSVAPPSGAMEGTKITRSKLKELALNLDTKK